MSTNNPIEMGDEASVAAEVLESYNLKSGIEERQKIKVTPALMNSLILALIVMFLAGYFIISNRLISHGFVINELNKKITELRNQNQDLELRVMNLESHEGILAKIEQLGMVAIDQIDYVEILDSNLARQ